MVPVCLVMARLVRPDGVPIVGARLSARLSRPDVALAAGYVVPEVVVATTAIDGSALLSLWPNALGAAASQYVVDVSTPEGVAWRVTATVPNVPTANLEVIADLPAYPGKSDQQVALEAVQHYAAQAAGAASAATERADVAGGHADAAGAAATTAAGHVAAAYQHRLAAGEKVALAAAHAEEAAADRGAAEVARAAAESAEESSLSGASAAAASRDGALVALAGSQAEKLAAQVASGASAESAAAAAAQASAAQASAAAALDSENATKSVMAVVAANLIQTQSIFVAHLNNT